ncbi:hypothetical protein [Radiobacillus deserti]|uniref:hypothetical protein n=1 Tax=Radiobacillus deserti TaxID=2594883 RepID=UPI001E601E31|nr:hypothetical protein [Radiobacillus deserti]
MDTVKGSFNDPEKIQLFLEEIYKRYPRYIRDQLQIIQRAVKKYQPFIHSALDVCIEQTLWSANDFHDVVNHLARVQGQEITTLSSDIPTIGMTPFITKKRHR